MFGEHNQGRPALVQSRVHARRDFHAARERQPNMHTVTHLVRGERAFDFLDDFFPRRNAGERQGAG